MPRIDNQKFYANALKLHGSSAKGLNWTSSAHQSLRFDILLDLLPQDLSSFSLVDAGCGFGDFYFYLQANQKSVKSYIGVDSVKEMCEVASSQTSQKILHADICKASIPNADFYICSGALNILTPFETVQFIQNCYNSSKKGFLFNVLHGEKESQTFNYLSTQKIKEIAKELKVKQIIMKSDYLQNDITIGFFR